MQPEERASALQWDMREASNEVLRFTENKTYEDLLQDRLLRLAVERDLEIIGEAANKISASLRQSHPEVAWRRIIGLRNVLAHDYGEIDLERIWVIIKEDLPALIPQLDALIPPDRS